MSRSILSRAIVITAGLMLWSSHVEAAAAFGWSVAMDQNAVLIGAPYAVNFNGRAHLFDAENGVLLHTFESPPESSGEGARFGWSVAIEGTRAIIGAPFATRPASQLGWVGQVHLFDRDTGSLVRTLNDPTPSRSVFGADRFGISVAGDGANILIGALDSTKAAEAGAAHLFSAASGELLRSFDNPTPSQYEYFGFTVAIDGNAVLVGAPGNSRQGDRVGLAHLLDANTGALRQTFDDPTPTKVDFFGSSVALDGDSVLIGARYDDTLGAKSGDFGDDIGQAHLFSAATGTLLHTFDDPMPTPSGEFGASVAIDGNHVLIGAPGDSAYVGQAHLFDASTGMLLRTFDDPTATSGDSFGYAVAINGDRVLIGSPGDDTQGRDLGQAYLFDAASGQLLQTFDWPGPFAPVPVPPSLVLFLSGFAALGVAAYRHR